MDEDRRITAVRTYLDGEFPGSRLDAIGDAQARRADAILFRVDDGPDVYLLEISAEFLDDRTPEEVERRSMNTGPPIKCATIKDGRSSSTKPVSFFGELDPLPDLGAGTGRYATAITHQGQRRYGRKATNDVLSGRDPAVLPGCE